MIEYDVIEGNFLPAILSKVRAAIEAGWEPLGGIAVTHTDSDSRYFYQAMTRQRQPGPPTIPFPHPVRSPNPTGRVGR